MCTFISDDAQHNCKFKQQDQLHQLRKIVITVCEISNEFLTNNPTPNEIKFVYCINQMHKQLQSQHDSPTQYPTLNFS